MESWLPFFVVVAALAIVFQAGVLVVMFLQIRRTTARMEQALADLHGRLSPILDRVQRVVDETSPRITSIVSDAAELTRMARSQAQRVDRVFTETMERLRMQLIHADQILTGAMEAVEEAGLKFRETIWGPMVKASALIRGIQTGLEFFKAVRRNSPPAEPQTEQQDESLFI